MFRLWVLHIVNYTKRGSLFLQLIATIISNFTEFNSTINRNVQQFNMASLITLT